MAHPDRFLLAGVMGWPVMHSRSPMLHNYWFKQHGLAGTYVRLVNRSLARAKGIAEEFGGPIKALPWEGRNDALEGAAMVVNTTSCGMVGQPALDIKLDKLPKSALAADIIYIPLETPFLAAARKRGN